MGCRGRRCIRGCVRYERDGLRGLEDRSHRPASCPHRVDADVEALVCTIRKDHPRWGPRRLRHELRKRGVRPVPGRATLYRMLVRNNLIAPVHRRRRREDYICVGAAGADGAVAAGHRRQRDDDRRHRGEGHHRRRRPFSVLRHREGGAAGHRPGGVRCVRDRDAALRGAGRSVD